MMFDILFIRKIKTFFSIDICYHFCWGGTTLPRLKKKAKPLLVSSFTAQDQQVAQLSQNCVFPFLEVCIYAFAQCDSPTAPFVTTTRSKCYDLGSLMLCSLEFLSNPMTFPSWPYHNSYSLL